MSDSQCTSGADTIVICGTCGVWLDADYDMFFENENEAIVCLQCWIELSAQAVAS